MTTSYYYEAPPLKFNRCRFLQHYTTLSVVHYIIHTVEQNQQTLIRHDYHRIDHDNVDAENGLIVDGELLPCLPYQFRTLPAACFPACLLVWLVGLGE